MNFIEQANAALADRAKAFEARKAVLDDAALSEADKRSRVEAIDADMDRLAAVADAAVQAEEREANARAIATRAAKFSAGQGTRVPGQAGPAEDANATFRKLAKGEIRQADFEVRTPSSPALTGNSAGANTVPITFSSMVIDSLYQQSQLLRMARVIATQSGEEIVFPVKARSGNLGRAVTPKSPATNFAATEGTVLTEGESEWGTLPLHAYKKGVIVQASRELIDDSIIDIAGELARDAAEAIMMDLGTDLAYGTGTSQAEGIVYYVENTGAAQIANVANLAGLTFDTVMSLYNALPAPYRPNAAWLANDAGFGGLRSIKDTLGHFLWTPSVSVDIPDAILGRPVVAEPNMVTSGANKAVLLFADPSRFLVRIAGGLRVTRSDEYGWGDDLVSFKVTTRFDSVVTDGRGVRGVRVTA